MKTARYVTLLILGGLGSTHARAEVAGTYRFDTARSQQRTVNGKQLPSCGSSAVDVLADLVPLTLVYNKAASTVSVNAVAWTVVHQGSNVFAVKEVKEPRRHQLTVLFEHDKRSATGWLVRWELDDQVQPSCVDALRLSGSFRSSPSDK